LRILTIGTLDQGGGAEKVARDLVAGYRQRGHDAVLAVGRKRSDDPGVLAIAQERDYQPRNPQAPTVSSITHILARRAEGAEDFDFPGTWDILDLPTARPDVLHAHNLHGWYFDLRALPWLSRTVPVVLTMHDAWLLSGHCAHSFGCERWRTGCGECPDLTIYPAVERDATAQNWERKREIYRRSRLHIATPCRWMMDKVQSGILAEGLVEGRVIHNGIDLSVFRPGDKAMARTRLGVPLDATVLLFTANSIRNNPWKDYAGMRRVIERLGGRLSGRRLILIGLGESAPSERLGNAEIVFVPFQTDPALIAAFYQAADLYLHMAQVETFPNVIMEALCCGTPVAATAVGGIPEQVLSDVAPDGGAWKAHSADTATGLLASLGDVDTLTEELVRLFHEPDRLRRMGINAAEDGRRRFDLQRCIGEYTDWFAELTTRATAPVTARQRSSTEISGMTVSNTSASTPDAWLGTLNEALAQGRPVSRVFGLDRGTPIDRHYIDSFLNAQAASVRGRVLELGDSTYTRRYGGDRVTRSDVLHAQPGNPSATIVGDLTRSGDLPAGVFDCIILTQTLQFIYDVRAALTNLRCSLAPGGVLLATFPGITPISRYDMDRWGEFWRFTSRAAQRMFDEVFTDDRVEVFVYGNAASATAFLNGVALEEMPAQLLDPRDPDYEVILAVKVTRIAPVAAKAAPRRTTGRADGGAPPVILMYHRVTDLAADPQLLSVKPARFSEHLDVIARVGRPMSVIELVEELRRGRTPSDAIAVTFDDGYADNLLYAKPRLAARSIPATVFITAGMLEQAREFWWDDLERLLLTPSILPGSITLATSNGGQTFALGESAHYTEADACRDADWSVIRSDDPTPRHALYRIFQKVLSGYGEEAARRQLLNALANWTGLGSGGRPSHRAMTRAEVVELVAGGVIDVGAHTMTHPQLARLPLATQGEEIEGSRRALEAIIGGPVPLFAYPYGWTGSYTSETVGMLRDLGFEGACSTTQSVVQLDSDPYQLPRMLVRDWSGEEFEHRLAAFRHQAAG
jgi:glycosyltransferase involved in cell wall biosynthesis/peptidoglycan/xylan/chitin deacetylase (PgdA/CDA1 family)